MAEEGRKVATELAVIPVPSSTMEVSPSLATFSNGVSQCTHEI